MVKKGIHKESLDTRMRLSVGHTPILVKEFGKVLYDFNHDGIYLKRDIPPYWWELFEPIPEESNSNKKEVKEE